MPSGIAADRWGRKRTLLVGAVANAAGCAVFAVSYTFLEFTLGEILFALGTALISGADSALVYDSFAAEKRQNEYPRAERAGQAAWLVVTAVGLPLTDEFLVRGDDPVLAYWATGTLSLVGVVCAALMTEPPRGRRQTLREITLGAAADVVRLPGVLRIIAYSVGLFLLLRAAIVSFYNPVLEASGIPVDDFGLVLAVINIVGAASVLFLPRLQTRFGERGILIAMPAALVVMFAFLIPIRTPPAAVLFVIQGAVFGAYPVVVRTLLNRRVPGGERRATILSLESMTCRIGFAGVAIFAAWSLGALGLGASIALTTALCCLPFLLIPLLASERGADRRV